MSTICHHAITFFNTGSQRLWNVPRATCTTLCSKNPITYSTLMEFVHIIFSKKMGVSKSALPCLYVHFRKRIGECLGDEKPFLLQTSLKFHILILEMQKPAYRRPGKPSSIILTYEETPFSLIGMAVRCNYFRNKGTYMFPCTRLHAPQQLSLVCMIWKYLTKISADRVGGGFIAFLLLLWSLQVMVSWNWAQNSNLSQNSGKKNTLAFVFRVQTGLIRF